MGNVLSAGAAAALAALSFWGWGRAFCALSGRRPPSAPIAATLGVAAVVCLGGLLNLCRLARPLELDLTLGAGLAVAIALLARSRPRLAPGLVLAAAPIVLTGAFLAARMVPATAFNAYDDFEKYFAFPARMLATGTLAGNRLSALGSETLGGQSFLQGFLLAHLKPDYIGAADNFFCLLLCLALAGCALTPGRRIAWAIAAEASVLVLNPQIINVSAVYSGAALVMAACLLGAGGNEERPPPAWRGLLYAGMTALKTTFAGFAGLHLAALALMPAREAEPGRSGWREAAASAGWTGLFLGPWILLSAPRYLAALSASVPHPAALLRVPYALLSTAPEQYGATQAHSTALAAAALLAGAAAVLSLRRGWVRSPAAAESAAAALLAGGAVYFAFTVALQPELGRQGATRYAGAILIGALPAALRTWPEMGWISGRRAWPIALVAAATAAFLPSALFRARQIADFGTPLAFSPSATSRPYLEYNRYVLHGPARARLASIQSLVPPGERIVAWIKTPFLLDYRRNQVLETNEAGLGSPWAWPPSARYYLWQYRGYAVKFTPEVITARESYARLLYGANSIDRISLVRSLAFGRYLGDRLRSADVLYDDGSIVLFRTR